MSADRYILLTAAKNEQDYLEEAIRSVLRQSIKPLAWFIIDDGSTDQTSEIISRYATKHPFIHLRQSKARNEARDFGSKDKAINAAFTDVGNLEFDFVGIQDADIAFERDDYYEMILKRFDLNPRLGIAGGYICEKPHGTWEPRKTNSPDSVAGAIQFFRRECFEQIKGYTALSHGGEDTLAQLDARMSGWQVLACSELRVFHYRPTSSAGGKWRGHFRAGLMDASFDSHPVFELLKCLRRATFEPVLVGGLARFGGYCWWHLTRRPPVIPSEKVEFLRREQRQKLSALLKLPRTERRAGPSLPST